MKHDDEIWQYDDLFRFDQYFKADGEQGEAWATAFRYLVEDGYIEDLADLIAGSDPIPYAARKLLAQHLRSGLEIKSQKGKKNKKLTPSDMDELESRVQFLWDNCSRILVLLDEISDRVGCEPIEIKAKIDRLKNDGLNALSDKFNISKNRIRHLVSADESKKWMAARSGKKLLDVGSKMVNLVHDNNQYALEREVDEGCLALKFQDVYLNPLSPEALLPGSFDPHYLDWPISIPYPTGSEPPSRDPVMESMIRGSGWWAFPHLDPNLSESNLEKLLGEDEDKKPV